eukprot:6677016-Alexandrium_andersonii.AAC.1
MHWRIADWSLRGRAFATPDPLGHRFRLPIPNLRAEWHRAHPSEPSGTNVQGPSLARAVPGSSA